jgi:hypothetical protein
MKRIAAVVFCGTLAGLALSPAFAQAARYPVQHAMDFDIWCTEVQRIAWQRCDKRLPEDMQKFEAYRTIVERYEIPYLQEKDSALHFDQNFLHNDPVDKKPDSTVAQPPSATAGP